MKHSLILSFATLSTALVLSLPASAHDPKAFDRMMDAEPATTISACDELKLEQQKSVSADADIKALKIRCDVEKESATASDSGHASADKK